MTRVPTAVSHSTRRREERSPDAIDAVSGEGEADATIDCFM